MSRNDRIFVHHGNKLEFFADLLAAWSLGACVIPIDSRLTQFEVETLAAATTPRFSLWHGGIDESIASTFADDVNVLETSDLFSEKSVAPPLALIGSDSLEKHRICGRQVWSTMIVESIEDHLIVAGNRKRMQVYEWLEVICSRPWMGAYLRSC